MKTKMISFALATLLLLGMFSVLPIFAENDVMDYLDIPEEVMTALKRKDDTQFIKTYGSCGLEYLHKTTIQEIIEKHDYKEYYISLDQLGHPKDLYIYYIRDDGHGSTFNQKMISETKSFLIKCLDFDNIESSISGGAKVTNCYICDDTVNHGGMYCYYETTKGDYILFREMRETTEPLYLVPEEKFREISKQYEEIMKEHANEIWGADGIAEHIDLSKYKYNPYQNLIIILSVVGVVAVAAVVGLVIWRKKKKAQKVQKTTAS